ncbi:helix-turn-helix transcriptional regulator [Donghicola mangrovi]|uniref:AlpA family phage regulatory protein n=1 Tax=Donghicola mangrovi TaxID=2729614 RepID=A0A850Q3N1_9RHOB|nr:AlpA family phage regulatory protein [Donghicola mangrovi]NVO22622.1 AlpA family phage regulatory protein [Donghicola mangrovi]
MEYRKLIKIKDVCAITKLSRATIYRKQQAGDFPSAIQLSVRSVAWYADEIEVWLGSRPRSVNADAANI